MAKLYVPKRDVSRIIWRATMWKRLGLFRAHLPDREYFLPTLAEVREHLAQDDIDKLQWRPEVFDCDEFSKALDTSFAMTAITDTGRRAPYAAGRIWWRKPAPHALNWVITSDRLFRIIEPQNDSMFRLERKHRQITFISA